MKDIGWIADEHQVEMSKPNEMKKDSKAKYQKKSSFNEPPRKVQEQQQQQQQPVQERKDEQKGLRTSGYHSKQTLAPQKNPAPKTHTYQPKRPGSSGSNWPKK
jgi:hypothetical protein